MLLTRRWVSLLVLGIAGLLVAVSVAGASTGTWTRVLPEAEGIESLVSDAQHVYVVYYDNPGHVVAINVSDGTVAWIRDTAAKPSLLAASGGLVWVASDVSQQLVTHDADGGRALHRFLAPHHSVWDAITSSGRVAYATSRAMPPSSPQYISTIGAGSIRTVRIRLPTHSLCPDLIVVSGALIAECLVGPDDHVELARLSPKTGAVLATGPLVRPPETDLVADGNALYADSFVNGEPRLVERYSATTLKLLAVGHPMRLALAAVTASPAGVFAAVVRSGGTRITRLNPTTLVPEASIPVPKGFDGAPYADRDSVYVVLDGKYGVSPETLARLRLPG